MNEMVCDLCRKKIRTWNPFAKAVKVVIRIKEHMWTEYYHVKCLEERGMLRKLKKEKSGRWDDDKEGSNTTQVVR